MNEMRKLMEAVVSEGPTDTDVLKSEYEQMKTELSEHFAAVQDAKEEYEKVLSVVKEIESELRKTIVAKKSGPSNSMVYTRNDGKTWLIRQNSRNRQYRAHELINNKPSGELAGSARNPNDLRLHLALLDR